MALKIRLRPQGRKNHRTYRMVVTDSKNPLDGKYTESVGWYNPSEQKEELQLSVNVERVQYWVSKGAQLTEKTESLIKRAQKLAK